MKKPVSFWEILFFFVCLATVLCFLEGCKTISQPSCQYVKDHYSGYK